MFIDTLSTPSRRFSASSIIAAQASQVMPCASAVTLCTCACAELLRNTENSARTLILSQSFISPSAGALVIAEPKRDPDAYDQEIYREARSQYGLNPPGPQKWGPPSYDKHLVYQR